MIKREITAWDFVKQEPKPIKIGLQGLYGEINPLHTFVPVGLYAREVDVTYVADNNNVFTVSDTAGNAVLNITDNDTAYITNLDVTGTANIPPSEGQVRYDNDTMMINVFIDNEWRRMSKEHFFNGPSFYQKEPKKTIKDRVQGSVIHWVYTKIKKFIKDVLFYGF